MISSISNNTSPHVFPRRDEVVHEVERREPDGVYVESLHLPHRRQRPHWLHRCTCRRVLPARNHHWIRALHLGVRIPW